MNITPQRRRRIMAINAVTLTVSLVLWWRSGSWVPLIGAGSGMLALVMAAVRPYALAAARHDSWVSRVRRDGRVVLVLLYVAALVPAGLTWWLTGRCLPLVVGGCLVAGLVVGVVRPVDEHRSPR